MSEKDRLIELEKERKHQEEKNNKIKEKDYINKDVVFMKKWLKSKKSNLIK